MSTPTPIRTPDILASIQCVRTGHDGRIRSIRIESLEDVRQLAQWCAMPMTHAGTRRIVLQSILDWLDGREAIAEAQAQEQADREAGVVAILREAALLVGQAQR